MFQVLTSTLSLDELNRRANAYAIGSLQDIRVELKGLKRRPGPNIFGPPHKTGRQWAHHLGGGDELQFNIIDIRNDGAGPSCLWHGVAFSFEPSQSYHWENLAPVLIRKARLFNEYVRGRPEDFADMQTWYWDEKHGGRPSSPQSPGPVLHEIVKRDMFVFLGKREPADEVDYDGILRDFDRLLPLFIYVESGGKEGTFRGDL